jgi:hypothetical protein
MRRLHLMGLSVVAILLLVSGSASAARSRDKVKQTAGPVWTLAMDGPRVAYASGGRVRVWNVVTGATSVIKGEYSNAKHSVNAAEIAIAGKRVAWIKREQHGNTEQHQRLFTATVGGSAHRLRKVLGYTDMSCGAGGSQITGLVGAGHVLAVSTWQASANGMVSTNRRLNLIESTRLRPIATGPNTIVAGATDGSRIAVVPLGTRTWQPEEGYCSWSPPTSVVVFSAGGKLLRRVETGPVGQIALSGRRLVAATPSLSPALEVYDSTTGALVQTWPVPARRVTDLGVSGRLAAYSVPNGRLAKLHVLDLTTGKDVVIATYGHSLTRGLAVGRLGLVYVANRGASPESRGKLVFVRMSKLLALMG